MRPSRSVRILASSFFVVASALAVTTVAGRAALDSGPAAPRASARPGVVLAPVRDAVGDAGQADVLVLLRDDAGVTATDAVMAASAEAVQTALLTSMPDGVFDVRWQYDMLPLVAGTVTAGGLAVLERHPLVEAVELDGWMEPTRTDPVASVDEVAKYLSQAVPSVGADYVHDNYHITGEGVTVAVLDTGIDNDHADFADKIVDQYCFASSRSCPPTDIVEGPSAEDEAGHGTAVSGIVLSKGLVSSVGVAPDAKLVAVRVFKDQGGAATSDIIKGLDFVLRKQVPLNVRIVNMSLGGGSSLGNNCDDQNPSMKDAFRRLVARQVIIFVATGNDGYPSQVSSPACISNSVAVGATYDVEAPTGGRWCPQQPNVTPLTIACFTNRGRAMDLLAPGIFIETSGMGGGLTRPGAGTSYAAPMAAGVAALILQVEPDLRPSEIEKIMRDTGTDVKHLENNDIFPLVNARRAIESILPDMPTPTATATATDMPPPTTPPTRSATEEPSVTPTNGAQATPTSDASPTPTRGMELATATPTTAPPSPDGSTLYMPALKRRVR